MKIITLCLVVCICFSACKKDENSSNVADIVTTNMKISNWKVLKFFDSGVDETSYFTGYNFTFNGNGTVNAKNSTNQYNGTWSVISDNSDDDSVENIHFNLSFSVLNTFDDLSNDWEILSQTATKVVLIDVSGGGSGTDSLIFARN